MNTRSNQTVMGSELLVSIKESDSSRELQIRCLYWGNGVVRLIVVDRAEIDMSFYQVTILAEARYSIKADRLSFPQTLLDGSELELCKIVAMDAIKERLS